MTRINSPLPDNDGVMQGGDGGGLPSNRASQCRRDALTGRWVIFAPGRSERPAEIYEAEVPAPGGVHCPFCAGNEAHTPPATFSIHDVVSHDSRFATAHHPDCTAGHEPWTVRVVPNLFPAVSTCKEAGTSSAESGKGPIYDSSQGTTVMTPEDAADFAPEACAGPFEDPEYHELLAATIELNPVSSKPIANDLFEVSDLHGGHEVIVETPQHVESLTALEPQHAGRVFEAYAERMRHWYDVPGVEYVVAFKNVGAAAGASLRHTHSQLIATSLLPPAMSEIGRRVTQHYRRHQKCLLCDMLEGELERGERIVLETERFLVFCPFASRLPYLVRIAPRMHSDRFELANASMLHELSRVAQQCLGAMEAMFSSCAYNYTLHTRPRNVASAASFHWWMEIFPRLTKVAGFEWGSDCYINPVTPELAASQLRKVISAKSSMG